MRSNVSACNKLDTSPTRTDRTRRSRIRCRNSGPGESITSKSGKINIAVNEWNIIRRIMYIITYNIYNTYVYVVYLLGLYFYKLGTQHVSAPPCNYATIDLNVLYAAVYLPRTSRRLIYREPIVIIIIFVFTTITTETPSRQRVLFADRAQNVMFSQVCRMHIYKFGRYPSWRKDKWIKKRTFRNENTSVRGHGFVRKNKIFNSAIVCDIASISRACRPSFHHSSCRFNTFHSKNHR